MKQVVINEVEVIEGGTYVEDTEAKVHFSMTAVAADTTGRTVVVTYRWVTKDDQLLFVVKEDLGRVELHVADDGAEYYGGSTRVHEVQVPEGMAVQMPVSYHDHLQATHFPEGVPDTFEEIELTYLRLTLMANLKLLEWCTNEDVLQEVQDNTQSGVAIRSKFDKDIPVVPAIQLYYAMSIDPEVSEGECRVSTWGLQLVIQSNTASPLTQASTRYLN